MRAAKHSTGPLPNSNRAKRQGVNSSGACEPCRRGKRRCDGVKPLCGACSKRELECETCVYAQLEGFSRSETLKHNISELTRERDLLRLFVKDVINSEPDTTVDSLLHSLDRREMPGALGSEVAKAMRDRRERCSIHPSSLSNGSPDLHTPAASSPERYLSSYYDLEDDHLDTTTKKSGLSTPSSKDLTFDRSCSPKGRRDFYAFVSNSHHQVDMKQSDSDWQADPAPRDEVAMGTVCTDFADDRHRYQTAPPTPERSLLPTIASSLHPQAHMQRPSTAQGYESEPNMRDLHILNFRVPVYMVQPLSQPHDSPLSRTYDGFRELAQQRVDQGWSMSDILGPVDFDVSGLIADENGYNPNTDSFSVPSLAISVMKTFPGTDMLVKLASAVYIARIMRWLIQPTSENYELLTENMRPTLVQRMIPHASELDFLPVPAMRDALIQSPRDYMCCFSSTHCNWPTTASYVQADHATGIVKLTQAFIEHVGSRENWYFDSGVLVTLPELESKCLIRDPQHERCSHELSRE